MPNSMRPGARRVRSWLWLAAALFFLAAQAQAQQSQLPLLQRAIDAYHAGDLTRAETTLDSLPAEIGAEDRAVAEIYRGLVAFAQDEPNTAGAAFRRALETLPSVRIDAAVHSPSRVALFDSVRTDLLSRWRGDALSAERRGENDLAMRRWRSVLAAEPADPMAGEGIRRLLANEAQQADPPQRRAEPPAAQRPANPGAPNPWTAVGLGLLVPGAGEFYVGRPLRGAAILGLAGGAAAAGLLLTRVEVTCRIPTAGECPAEDVLRENETRPYLGVGLATAAVLTLLGAIDAGVAAAQTPVAAVSRAARTTRVGADGRVHVTWLRLHY
jgi:tetratricopeptide (TPR) repeat protein